MNRHGGVSRRLAMTWIDSVGNGGLRATPPSFRAVRVPNECGAGERR